MVASIGLGLTLVAVVLIGGGDEVEASRDRGALPVVATMQPPTDAVTLAPPPAVTTTAPVEGQPLIQALEPGFINPCDVMRAAVDAAGMSIRIPAGGRYGEIDPGFRMCHASPDTSSWASPHSGLFVGSVWSDDEAERVLGSLFTVAGSSGIPAWVPTGSSTWAFDRSFNAAAVLVAPYLFVVTGDDPARAMQVAQAAAVELGSWEPDPNYVCGLLATASVGVAGFEQYPTGSDSLSEVCEVEGSELSRPHLFWRVPASTAEDAAHLLETADDLPLPAEVEWAATTAPARSGEAFPPRTWTGDGIDAAGDDFYAVAISTDPHFFIVTHAERDEAMDFALGVFDEVIERVPPEAP
jgi:hypothetical protein